MKTAPSINSTKLALNSISPSSSPCGTILTVTGLIAPTVAGTYHITANYAGESLYVASTSGSKTLTVS